MLEVSSWSMITVGNPASDSPSNFWTIVVIPSISDTIKVMTPQTVTICIGAEVNEVILFIANLISPLVVHLDSPTSLSATSK